MKNKVSAVFGFMDMCKIFVLQYNSKTTAASGNIFHGNGSYTGSGSVLQGQVQDRFPPVYGNCRPGKICQRYVSWSIH